MTRDLNILHICNDFCGSKVHTNLYKELDKLGVKQTVFNPIRIVNKNTIGCNEFEAKHTQFIYSPVVRRIHHYVYHIKKYCVFKSMLKLLNVKKFNLIHATTLLTDGGLAYMLYKRYHTPYIVAVRDTDLNGFLNKLPHTWFDARKILLNAQQIFFISPALKKQFEAHKVIKPIIKKIQDKIVIQPNGIDDYYLDYIKTTQHVGTDIIYIGDFSNRKNVGRLIDAVLNLRDKDKFKDIKLTLVGGGNNENDYVEKMIHLHPECIKHLGKINSKERLCDILCQNSIFAMPSITETFGLVYLEALSQNLAVLYTKGQGIDGLFSSSVGIAVNPFSVEEITSALQELLENRATYSNKDIDFTQFRWSLIAKRYYTYYKQILEKYQY